tara:strand:- start:970 stop:1626 length:657 start_codon:yes stop_codon:yes gene_type:complete
VTRVDVLDKGYVELIDFMGDDDAPIDAARVSFDRQASAFSKEKNDKLAAYLIKHNHTTPFEMVVFKFRVRAPVVVWWHWVRHRVASYNFQSGRYVPFDETEVYRPTEWRKQSKDNKQGSDGAIDSPMIAQRFSDERDALYEKCFDLYQAMLSSGVAREQARLVLPGFACYYDAIVLMNARSLQNFIGLRASPDAQSEIQEYANAIRSIVSKTHPRIFG